jgi:hypothetical protein
MALSSKSIRVFSAIEALRENRTDIRHALAALFEPDIAKFHGSVFDPLKISHEINSQYRLGITADVIGGFTDIFLELGWIEPISVADGSAYTVKCEPQIDVPSDLEKFKNKADQISREFRQFIQKISPLSQVQKSDSELVDDLIDWLMLLDRANEDNIKSAVKTYKVGNKIVSDFENSNEGQTYSESEFLSARFIDHLFKSNSYHISFLIELGEVGLITEVVRDFQRPLSSTKRTDLAVYLDAPLALDYLGLSGVAQQQSVESVLNGLIGIGGSVRIFRTSVNEMQSALQGVLARSPTERTGPTADAIRRRETFEPFVRQVSVKPDPYLHGKGVSIIEDDLNSFPGQHVYFSKHAYELLYSQIAWIREDAARNHDATIATLAMRKRAGAKSGDLFDVKHVVLTRNPKFPLLSRRISRENNYIGPNHVGPVIHHRQLATAIWLRAGAQQDSDIPRRYILSSCRRVLTLRKNIVEKIHNLKDGLSDEQAHQLELLLTEDRSAQALMDKTLGSANIIDSSNIPILLEEMKKAQISEFADESNKKINEMSKAARQREDALSSEISSRDVAIDSLKEHNDQVNSQIESVYRAIVDRTNSIIKRRRKIFAGAIVLSYIAFLAFDGLDTPKSIIAGVGFLTIFVFTSLVFQFSNFVERRFVRPIFERVDNGMLFKVATESGIQWDPFVDRVQYDGSEFKLAPPP